MIVATHMGMYMPALRPNWEKCIENGEPELQVRSRRKIDLLNLRALAQQWDLDLGPVIQLPNTDYQFRAYCTRMTWGWLLEILANQIDYTKFKDTPAKKHGDTALTNCYTKMWSAIFNAFPTGSIYARSWKRGSHRGSTQNRVMAEPERWTKRETITERREIVEWKKMSDLTDHELALLMRETDEPTDADIADIERESPIIDVTPSFMGVGPREINGHLDHTDCDHARTKTARRRCRKAWLDVKNS